MTKNKDIIILGIESSCDDTSASVLKGRDNKLEILSNVIANQSVHEQYGGVVPELASRAHQQNIIPVVDKAIKDAGIKKEDISAIAFTRGPGLIGSLLVGVSFVKAFSLAMNIPMMEVNHMQAHILAHFIDEPKPEFPFLNLTVSGGHTQIVKITNYLEMEILGQTLDDAAGEAYDKSAKILGLPYPGGPLIDKYAQNGEPLKFKFAEPQISNLDFSFSGLKTSILYFIQKEIQYNPEFIKENKNDLCASIQYTINTILLKKIEQAIKKMEITQVALSGGVSANSGLRKMLEENGKKNDWKVFIPQFQYCTDNAAMVAITGYYKYLTEEFVGQDVVPVIKYNF